MKLRIKDQSIRFRLSQNEVRKLDGESEIVASTYIGESTLTYVIKHALDRTFSCNFIEGKISVMVPKDILQTWCNSDQVSIECNLPKSGQTPSLQLLIEKDFQCLIERAGEDESGLFPNPQAQPQ